MQPTWERDGISLWLADCLDVLPTLAAGSVDAVVTSPPYAEQRAEVYCGVAEEEYPAWTANWLGLIPLSENGSALINIREHRKHDAMSDYVHKTRMELRGLGWSEVDELIWVKLNAMPTAPNWLPRRAWERILWFSRSRKPACDPLDRTHRPIGKLNMRAFGSRIGKGESGSNKLPEWPRKQNWFSTAMVGQDYDHPAMYPIELAEWMASFIPGTVLDPFMGSGTTGVACVRLGRKFIGIEREEKYFDIAVRRITAELDSLPLFAPKLTQGSLLDS